MSILVFYAIFSKINSYFPITKTEAIDIKMESDF